MNFLQHLNIVLGCKVERLGKHPTHLNGNITILDVTYL